MPDTTNYNALAGTLLTRGVATNVPLGTNGTYNIDILTAGDNLLTLSVDMTGSAQADLAAEVDPFEADGVTVQTNQVPPLRSDGPDLVGGHLFFTSQWDVSGYDKVRLIITNKNAAGQTVTRASWRLSGS